MHKTPSPWKVSSVVPELRAEPCRALQAAVDLARILFQLLLVIDVHALGAAMTAAWRAVVTAPQELRSAMCVDLYACIRDSDDYVRKHRLARWYQQLAAAVVKDQLSQSEGAEQTRSVLKAQLNAQN